MELAEKKRQVESLIRRGVLVTPEILSRLEEFGIERGDSSRTEAGKSSRPDAGELEIEKEISDARSETQKREAQKPNVRVVYSYKEKARKRTFEHFVSLFNSRYSAIQSILALRPELSNTTSINRLKGKSNRERASVIGIVKEKQETKNNNLLATIEDPTGQVSVLFNNRRPELFMQARDLTRDEIVGITGVSGDNIIFANELVLPDIPEKELRKSPHEGCAAFISDIQFGSKTFLENDFKKFLDWLNLKAGNESQQRVAEKIKYLFIVGDLVDGVGVYPGQEQDLRITDLKEQYRALAELLLEIPERIPLIICPGNHDAVRLAEPQPGFDREMAQPLFNIPNAILVSNPAIINIDSSQGFPGLDILLYHGASFDYYAANIDSIRLAGGYDRSDLIMKYLLMRRHLAPTYSSTVYLPDQEDWLVIRKVPDIFVSGHIHKSSVSNYRNTTLISSSCWQSKTAYQERVGHRPEPSRVPIIDLKTRNVKIIKFG